MEELENEELNRGLCALVVDDMFESWSPETQEQALSEWNDWEEPGKKNTWYYSELQSEAKGELRRDSCIGVYLHAEKRIGARRLPVDGFCSETQTVFQFHGKIC